MPSSSSTNTASNQQALILKHYIHMAELLGEMFAPILEVVVHDLRHPDHSIIAISNGHITGRDVGGSATDLGRRLMESDFPDKLINYSNESPSGGKLKSSSLAIRDEEGTLIGVVGFNLDITYFEQFDKFLKQFISTRSSQYVTEAEHFGETSPSEDIRDAIHNYLVTRNWNAYTLSNTDKREVVEHLYREGYFKNRGAVSIIARELSLSRPSIYNYKKDFIRRMREKKAET